MKFSYRYQESIVTHIKNHYHTLYSHEPWAELLILICIGYKFPLCRNAETGYALNLSVIEACSSAMSFSYHLVCLGAKNF